MAANETVTITVALDDIFSDIKSGKLKPNDTSVTVPDSYITYQGSHIDNKTTPPTIKIPTNSIVDFVINPAEYQGEEVEFEYFKDPYITPKPDGVAKHIDRYETPPVPSDCSNITMTIEVEHGGEEWTISWDPTVQVIDL